MKANETGMLAFLVSMAVDSRWGYTRLRSHHVFRSASIDSLAGGAVSPPTHTSKIPLSEKFAAMQLLVLTTTFLLMQGCAAQQLSQGEKDRVRLQLEKDAERESQPQQAPKRDSRFDIEPSSEFDIQVASYTLKLAANPPMDGRLFGPMTVTDSLSETSNTRPLDELLHTTEDQLVKIDWRVASDRVEFALTNKSDDVLKINWNEVTYVDATNVSHKTFHQGIRIAGRNEDQPASLVVGGTTIKDAIIPTDNAIATEHGWFFIPLLPHAHKGHSKAETQAFKAEARTHVGKTLKVLLPLEQGGKSYEYLYTFRAEDVSFATIAVTSEEFLEYLGPH